MAFRTDCGFFVDTALTVWTTFPPYEQSGYGRKRPQEPQEKIKKDKTGIGSTQPGNKRRQNTESKPVPHEKTFESHRSSINT